MDNLDNFRERFEALAQQMEHLQHQTQALEAHTRTIERRLHWWRGVACGVLLLGLLSWALPLGTAQEESTAEVRGGLAQRLTALERRLKHITLATGEDNLPEVRITGANLGQQEGT